MEKGISLYEIAEAYNRLDSFLEANDELGMQEYLDAIETQMENKVDNIVRFSRNLEMSSIAVNSEIERLQKIQKEYHNKSKALINYIDYSMRKHGIEKVDTNVVRLSYRKSSGVEITNESLLPEEFIVIKTTKQPNKIAIKEAIAQGVVVPGAIMEERKNLQVK